MKEKLISILLVFLIVLMFFSIEKVLAVNVIKNGGFEIGEPWDSPPNWNTTGNAYITITSLFGEQGLYMSTDAEIEQFLTIPIPVADIEEPFGVYAVARSDWQLKVEFVFTDLTNFLWYWSGDITVDPITDEDWDFCDIRNILRTYMLSKTLKEITLICFSSPQFFALDEVGNPYIEEEEEEEKPFNWGWLKWLLALIILIIIVSFAFYIKHWGY